MDFNMVEIMDTIMRSFLSLFVLFVVTKIIGKKQVSELSLFDYVIGISIGNFAAEMSINLETSEVNGILAVIIFGFIAYLVSIISQKSMSFRRFFFGTPTVIIEDGKILEKSMKKCRIDLNDLLEQSRIAGYFDISEISYAIMESNGSMSFLPYDKYAKPTKEDLKIKEKKVGILANVVLDSEVMHNNLKSIGKDENWLMKELKKKNISSLDNILLVTVDVNNKISIFTKNRDRNEKRVLE